MVLTLLGGLWLLTLHISGSGSFPRPLTAKQERECLERLKQGDRTVAFARANGFTEARTHTDLTGRPRYLVATR